MVTKEISSKLGFLEAGQLIQFPEWARFLIEIGQEFSKNIAPERKLVIAISLPDTSFAAPLVGTGMVVEKSTLTNVSSTEDHFANLMRLPSGTEVVLETSGKLDKANILPSISFKDKKTRVRLQLSRRNYVTNIPIAGCHRINIGDHTAAIKEGRSDINFIRQLLGNDIAQNYPFFTSYDCLFCGDLSVMRREILNTHFYAKVRKEVVGSLQAILRVRKFPLTTTPFYRSAVESPRSKTIKRFVEPTTVIFRDSFAFSKAWQRFPNSNWVILLGKAESRYESALSLVESRLSQRGLGRDSLAGNIGGIEGLWFQEEWQGD